MKQATRLLQPAVLCYDNNHKGNIHQCKCFPQELASRCSPARLTARLSALLPDCLLVRRPSCSPARLLTSLPSSRLACPSAWSSDRLYCTVGVHPTRCSEFESSGDPHHHLQQLLELAREGKSKGKVRAIFPCRSTDCYHMHSCAAVSPAVPCTARGDAVAALLPPAAAHGAGGRGEEQGEGHHHMMALCTVAIFSPLKTSFMVLLTARTICLLCPCPLQVVAVGECGLDYDRLVFCPADVQKK